MANVVDSYPESRREKERRPSIVRTYTPPLEPNYKRTPCKPSPPPFEESPDTPRYGEHRRGIYPTTSYSMGGGQNSPQGVYPEYPPPDFAAPGIRRGLPICSRPSSPPALRKNLNQPIIPPINNNQINHQINHQIYPPTNTSPTNQQINHPINTQIQPRINTSPINHQINIQIEPQIDTSPINHQINTRIRPQINTSPINRQIYPQMKQQIIAQNNVSPINQPKNRQKQNQLFTSPIHQRTNPQTNSQIQSKIDNLMDNQENMSSQINSQINIQTNSPMNNEKTVQMHSRVNSQIDSYENEMVEEISPKIITQEKFQTIDQKIPLNPSTRQFHNNPQKIPAPHTPPNYVRASVCTPPPPPSHTPPHVSSISPTRTSRLLASQRTLSGLQLNTHAYYHEEDVCEGKSFFELGGNSYIGGGRYPRAEALKEVEYPSEALKDEKGMVSQTRWGDFKNPFTSFFFRFFSKNDTLLQRQDYFYQTVASMHTEGGEKREKKTEKKEAKNEEKKGEKREDKKEENKNFCRQGAFLLLLTFLFILFFAVLQLYSTHQNWHELLQTNWHAKWNRGELNLNSAYRGNSRDHLPFSSQERANRTSSDKLRARSDPSALASAFLLNEFNVLLAPPHSQATRGEKAGENDSENAENSGENPEGGNTEKWGQNAEKWGENSEIFGKNNGGKNNGGENVENKWGDKKQRKLENVFFGDPHTVIINNIKHLLQKQPNQIHPFQLAPAAADIALQVLPGQSSSAFHGQLGFASPSYGRSPEPLWNPLPPPPPLTSENEKEALERGGGFYLEVSDSLPLDRQPVDARDEVCLEERYDYGELSGLGASVVITFHNEPLSTLLRSVHSVLNLTPPFLLREIILVDDCSDSLGLLVEGVGGGFLEKTGKKIDRKIDKNVRLNYYNQGADFYEIPSPQVDLKTYIAHLPKVRLLRQKERRGIVPARMRGIRAAQGNAVVILDSHIEVQPQWIEPLLKRILNSPNSLVFPQIDSINPNTFEYNSHAGIGCWLSFGWNVQEKARLTGKVKSAAPIRSPTHAGGLLAFRKDFFLHLGGYDDGSTFWGAENIELSFRTWMCGGKVECAPCSRVYHIFRAGGVGYSSPPSSLWKNRIRTAKLWMGTNYFPLAAAHIPYHLSHTHAHMGSIQNMLEVKERLSCESFDWFLRNIDPGHEFGRLSEELKTVSEIKLSKHPDKCLDSLAQAGPTVGIYNCHHQLGTQGFLFLTEKKMLRLIDKEKEGGSFLCVSPPGGEIYRCDEKESYMLFESSKKEDNMFEGRIVWSPPPPLARSCLTHNPAQNLVFFGDCGDENGVWIWFGFPHMGYLPSTDKSEEDIFLNLSPSDIAAPQQWFENRAVSNMCLDSMQRLAPHDLLGLYPCHHNPRTQGFVYYKDRRQVRVNPENEDTLEPLCLSREASFRRCKEMHQTSPILLIQDRVVFAPLNEEGDILDVLDENTKKNQKKLHQNRKNPFNTSDKNLLCLTAVNIPPHPHDPSMEVSFLPCITDGERGANFQKWDFASARPEHSD